MGREREAHTAAWEGEEGGRTVGNSGTEGAASFIGRKNCPKLKTKEMPEEQNLNGLCWDMQPGSHQGKSFKGIVGAGLRSDR